MSPDVKTPADPTPRTLVVSAAIVAVSVAAISTLFLGGRILRSGYGADNDTWLMLGTWDVITLQGRYVPSRFQGYPLAEIMIGAASDLGGHWLSGAVSVVLALATTLLLYDLLRRRCTERVDRVLWTTLLVVSPTFVVAATTSIDYLYGLTFFLAAWVAFERGASRWSSGLLFGLAAAARITYLPLAAIFLLMQSPRSGRKSDQRVGALVILVAVTALSYLPALIYSGISASAFRAERPTNQGVGGLVGRAILKAGDLLGTAGSMTAVVLIAVIVLAIRRTESPLFREAWLPVALAIQLALWIWLPVEPSYLLPALVMVLVALAPHAQGPAIRGLLIVLVVATASSGWISLQFLEYRYANVYGVDSCEPTEATGATVRVDVEPGVLLDYPEQARLLLACNEAQRAAQLERP